MHSLPIFVRLAGAPVLVVGEGAAAAAKARLVVAAGGTVVTETGPGVRLAFVALDDAGAAATAAARLKEQGLLVNVVDRPALCDFTVPAIVDRAPVIVAVGTGGASATLAKALRERFEALLPAGLGRLADAIFAARATVAVTHPTMDDRRRLWDAALAPGGVLDPLADHADPAAAIAALGPAADTSSFAAIVLTSADPDDMTLRQLRLLNQADVIFVGDGVPDAVLDRARRDAERVVGAPASDRPSGRSVALSLASSAAG